LINNNQLVRTLLILGGLLIIAFLLSSSCESRGGTNGNRDMPVTEVITMAKAGQIREIEVSDNKLIVYPRATSGRDEGRPFRSRMDSQTDLVSLLLESGAKVGPPSGVQVTFKGSSGMSSFLGIVLMLFPIILIGGLMFWMMRRGQGGGGQNPMQFGRTTAKKVPVDRPLVTFGDVAGVEEAKAELREVVEFLRSPLRFQSLGAKIPKGVLLVGQPGTGKTLLARAVAGEAGAVFFHISGSEFVEMFVGVGAARVRDLFGQAKRNTPCIVFIDEIDAVGRQRGAGLGGGNDEREQTLNQILVEMDGFEANVDVIVLAATNRPDVLDPALLRPGRFDRRVTLDLPDIEGRKAILEVHSKGKPLAPEVSLGIIAKQTPGFSGADLANLINEGAILAVRSDRKDISMVELEEAIERVTAGPERKSRVISAREKGMVAYHESGHALVAWCMPHADRVHKISIVSRGTMGGHTSMLPEEDRYLWTKNQFQDFMAVAMGGRVAEQLIFDELTTGASNDFERATKIAENMIKRYGMSKNLGPRTLGKRQELIFLGREVNEEQDYGEGVAADIDREVKSLLDEAYERAENVLAEHKAELVKVAEYLLEHETMSGETLEEILTDAHD